MVHELLKRSRQHLKNLIWGTVEYLFYPLLMLMATPLLLRSLGTTGFGLWMVVMAVTGLGGIAGMGLGATTITYVARYRGNDDFTGAVVAVRKILALTLAGASIFSIVICMLSPFLAHRVFPNMGVPSTVAWALATGSGILFLQQADTVFAAAIKGFERYDLAAPMEIAIKSAGIVASTTAAFLCNDVNIALLTWMGVTARGLCARAALASRIAGKRLYVPRWTKEFDREFLSFAGWNWIHGIASAIFQQLDRFLIASLLGASAIVTYSVCTQLALQVHAIPAAGLGFLLPMVSRRLLRSQAPLSRLRNQAIMVNAVFAAALALPLILFGEQFLALWIGPEFAREASPLLFWMTLVYGVLALGVAPHYLLLGRGQARFISFNSMVGGILSTVSAAVLIPAIGIFGGLVGRAMHVLLVIATYVRLYKEK